MSRRILVVSPSWVGDTVLAQPLLRRLHELHPGLRLEVLAAAALEPLLLRMSEVAEVVTNPFGHGELGLARRRALGRSLRERHYDQALVLPNSMKSALVPWFARIPLRTGYRGEMRFGLLNDVRELDKAATPLLVERYVRLADAAGAPPGRPATAPRLVSQPAARRLGAARLGLALNPRIVCLCPGAEYGPSKRWPEQHFADLAAALHVDGFTVWLLGSARDRELGERIRSLSGGVAQNLCGRTSLGEAVDLLGAACMVVSNDSGLMHIAAALARPLVALFGSSSPGYTPPLSASASILNRQIKCSPCFKRTCPLGHQDCLRLIEPVEVHRLVMARHKPPPP